MALLSEYHASLCYDHVIELVRMQWTKHLVVVFVSQLSRWM